MLTSLAAFFKEMHAGNKNGCVSPGHLFGQVVKQSPKFRGMQQQDSQVCFQPVVRSKNYLILILAPASLFSLFF